MTYVFQAQKLDLPKIIDFYEGDEIAPASEHIFAMFKTDGKVVTIYKTLKVTIQGKDAYEDYLMWSEIVGFPVETVPILTEVKPIHVDPLLKLSTIGSDEVGTGDFYGPVVVCAAYIPKEDIENLSKYPLRDSKKLDDEVILSFAEQLMKDITHHVIVLPNLKYNELVDQGYNLNKIKAYLHNHAIRKLLLKTPQNYDRIVIDEFCPKDLYFKYLEDMEVVKNITFMQKAEDQVISVAAASIIARYTFLKEMDLLSKNLGITLPKGAGIVVDLIGKRIALEKGFDVFREISKVHFKNYQKIKDLMK